MKCPRCNGDHFWKTFSHVSCSRCGFVPERALSDAGYAARLRAEVEFKTALKEQAPAFIERSLAYLGELRESA